MVYRPDFYFVTGAQSLASPPGQKEEAPRAQYKVLIIKHLYWVSAIIPRASLRSRYDRHDALGMIAETLSVRPPRRSYREPPAPLKTSIDRVLGMSHVDLSWGRSSRPLLPPCS